jgi:hypothetical protein
MVNFMTLSCPSCGGKLQITNDIERFACSHCGNEHLVRRSGGLVSVLPIVDELAKVKIGVDKTASELAIRRLQGELDDLEKEYADNYSRKSRTITPILVWMIVIMGGLYFAIVGLYFATSTDLTTIILGIALLVFGSLFLYLIIGKRKYYKQEMKRIMEVARNKRTEIERLKKHL